MTPRQRWTLVATIIGSGAVFLDGTVVNVALKRIGEELPASFLGVLEGQTYIVSGYLAVLAALLLLSGAVSDHFGRRRTYAIGLASFGATSALCGLAPTLEWLALFRLFQGAAGALLVPGSLALITDAFPSGSRGQAFGMWAAATSGLVLIGPLIGGLLVDTVGWRAAFLINVPVLAVALWATLARIGRDVAPSTRGTFDWLGSVVAALAVGGVTVGLIRGQESAWTDPLAWAALAVGVVALITFPILMAHSDNPLVPLGLFRSRTFATVNLATFFIYGALYVTLSYQGLIMQGVLGYTALAAGAAALPMGIFLTVLSTRVGAAAGRLGARPFLVAGPLIMASGVLWYTRLPVDSAPWLASFDDPATLIPPIDTVTDILPAAALFGIGISFVVAPLTNALMGSVPGRHAGLGSAINNALSRIGQPLLGSIVFIIVNATFYGQLSASGSGVDPSIDSVRRAFPPLNPPAPGATPDQVAAANAASIEAFHGAMLGAAALLIVGAAVDWYGLRSTSPATGSSTGSPATSPAPPTEPSTV